MQNASKEELLQKIEQLEAENKYLKKENKQQFSDFFYKNPLLMAITSVKSGCLLEINDAFEKAIGYKRKEVVGKSTKELNLFLDKEKRKNLLKKLSENKILIGEEAKIKTKSGEIINGFFLAKFIEYSQEKCLLTFMLDISKQKEMQNLIIKTQKNIQAIFNNTLQSFILVNKNRNIIFFNEYAQKINLRFYNEKLAEGKRIDKWIIYFDQFKENFDAALKGERKKYEILLDFKGEKYWAEIHLQPVFDTEANEITGVFLIGVDINERKKAQLEIEKSKLILKNQNETLKIILEKKNKTIQQKKILNELLIKSEALFRSISENSPNGVFVCNTEGRITYSNKLFLNLLGVSEQEIIGQKWLSIIKTDDNYNLLENIWSKAQKGFEILIKSKNREIEKDLFLKLRGRELKLEEKKIGYLGIVEDVTQQKHFEETTRTHKIQLEQQNEEIRSQNEELFQLNNKLNKNLKELNKNQTLLRKAQKIAKIGSWERLLDSDTLLWSEQVYRNYGLPVGNGQIDRNELEKWILPDDYKRMQLRLKNAIEKKKKLDIVYRIKTPQGQIRYLHGIVEMKYDINGNCIQLFGTNQNITKLKKIEIKLRENELKFRQMAEFMQEVFWLRIPNKILYVNPAYEKIWGKTRESLYLDANSFVKIIHEDDQKKLEKAGKEFSTSGKFDLEFRIIKKSGEIRWIWARSFAISYKNNRVDKSAGVAQDITERKQSEEALKESEEKYRTLVEKSNDAIIIQNDMKLLFANKKTCELTGYTIGELYDMDFLKLVSPSEREQIIKFHKKRYEGEKVPNIYETILISKNKKLISAEFNNNIITYKNKKSTMTIIRDLTERKKAQEELTRLALAIEQITEGVVIFNKNGIVEYSNPAFLKMTGYSYEEIKGKSISVLRSFQHSSDFYQALEISRKQGKEWKGRIINKRKDNSLYHEFMVLSPVRNTFGNVSHFVAVKRDITKDVSDEKKKNQAQKLQAIGTLAGGIAHDFNNILMGIQIYTELIASSLEEKHLARNFLSPIEQAQKRAKELVKQILTFSRQSEEERKPLLIHLVLKEALNLLSATLPATIKIKKNIENCGYILANPTHIHQIIINLCNNANDSMNGQGTIDIELKKVENKKDFILLKFKDSGCGIDKKIKERIFDPFFTTKEVGKGTGLGLSTVHGIVKQYEGFIEVKSEINIGTIFYIYLPQKIENEIKEN